VIYEALLAPVDGFESAVRDLVDDGTRGFNVTVPFKEAAWRLVDETSERAAKARAVNTVLVRDDGAFFGDNTDGIGLVRDLQNNNQVRIAGSRVLLVGAGGAARGVVGLLLEREPALIFIANRTASRARALAGDFRGEGKIVGGGFSELRGERFDLVINATSGGLQGKAPRIPLTSIVPGGVCYDMLYGSGPTPFLKWARAAGAGRRLDGWGMLVEQAAEAFALWRGVRPDSRLTIRELDPGRSVMHT